MITKMIYVASPYNSTDTSKPEPEQAALRTLRCALINQVIGNLQDQYPYAFIGPITMSHETVKYMKNKDVGFQEWQVRDFTYINWSDEMWIIKLLGWEKSRGIREEESFARLNGMPIKYFDVFFTAGGLDVKESPVGRSTSELKLGVLR